MKSTLSFEVKLDQPYDKAIETVTAALKTEGFGILTQIDIKATLKEKIGEDFRPYMILGACNPHLAHRALSSHAEVGVMLPCNVTVEATSEGGSIIRIVNPDEMMSVGGMGDDPVMREVAGEAGERLRHVVTALQDLNAG
ncbi:MAG: DUF302 domain-containing protein [Candidatus Krumholzibacteriota bacterium]|nr:DUF302 domain-containing protein [Candidatus Krumholzibacteriota bacterium]